MNSLALENVRCATGLSLHTITKLSNHLMDKVERHFIYPA